MLIRENRMLPNAVLAEVMRDIANSPVRILVWRCASVSHLIVESSVSGFIDIDSIRKNRRKGSATLPRILQG